MEIASAFGSLKAYHFETEDNNGSCAFLEVRVHFFSYLCFNSFVIFLCTGGAMV